MEQRWVFITLKPLRVWQQPKLLPQILLVPLPPKQFLVGNFLLELATQFLSWAFGQGLSQMILILAQLLLRDFLAKNIYFSGVMLAKQAVESVTPPHSVIPPFLMPAPLVQE